MGERAGDERFREGPKDERTAEDRLTARVPPGRATAALDLTRLAPDVLLLAVSLAAGLGLARLTITPSAPKVLVPIVATVIAGHLAASLARRLRMSLPVVLVSGVLAVALATVWGLFGFATRFGIPTPTTWRALVARFEEAGTVIRAHPTPVPATPGVVLCVAAGAGLVAVLGRTVWASQDATAHHRSSASRRPRAVRSPRSPRPLVALAPSFGLLCYTALLSSQIDRVWGATTYLVAALLFVAAADWPTPQQAGVAGRPAGRTRRTQRVRPALELRATVPALVCAVVAVLVPLAFSPVLSTLHLSALPFPQRPGSGAGVGFLSGPWGGSHGGDGGAGGTSSSVHAIDLVDNLQSVLSNSTTDTMFTARTSVATYWQVAVLTYFDGKAWVPDPTTQAAARNIPLPLDKSVAGLPALPEPAPTATFRATVTIGDLQSPLLPLPPTAVSVDAIGADIVPGFGALQPIEAAPGLSYTTVARYPTAPTNARGARGASAARAPATGSSSHLGPPTTGAIATPPGTPEGSATPTAASEAPYLQLPSVSGPVVQLAHAIVSGLSSPAAQAAALARWFDTGRYRYTLAPPPPAGGDPLTSFLFTTKAGFCQQFAAAYAVLARIDGLPTRVAVGFTTGAPEGRGEYRVTGADAHVWPEVYLGPTTGWTSYEPTPASSGEPSGVGVLSGAKSPVENAGASSSGGTPSTLPNIRRAFAPAASAPSTVPLSVRNPASRVRTGGSGSWPATGFLAAICLLAAALLIGASWWRRHGNAPRYAWRRWRPLRRVRNALRHRTSNPGDPTAEVLAYWRDAAANLDGVRLGRRPSETLQEHAARLRALVDAQWLRTPAEHRALEPPRAGASIAARPGAQDSKSTASIASTDAGATADVGNSFLTPDSSAEAMFPGWPGRDAPRDPVAVAIDAYRTLSELAARASYAHDPCTADEAVHAEHLEATVRAGLRSANARRSVLRV